MRVMLVGVVLSAGIAVGDASAAESSLVVNVATRDSQGQVHCHLFRSDDGFPMKFKKALKHAKSSVKDKKATCAFSELSAGQYAVVAFHDANSDGELDTNFIGMPKEGVGVSNNAKGRMGPPDYDDARFDFSGASKTLSIQLRYR